MTIDQTFDNEWDAHEKEVAARIETAVGAIKTSTTLHNLHAALISFETAYAEIDREADIEGGLKSEGIDICELPTFGGPAPRSTVEVWSWDDDQLLVGVGPFTDWRIVDRDGTS